MSGSDPQKKGKIDETSMARDQKKEPNPYEEFFENFPGMKVLVGKYVYKMKRNILTRMHLLKRIKKRRPRYSHQKQEK